MRFRRVELHSARDARIFPDAATGPFPIELCNDARCNHPRDVHDSIVGTHCKVCAGEMGETERVGYTGCR